MIPQPVLNHAPDRVLSPSIFHLEDENPEETDIRELDRQIDDAMCEVRKLIKKRNEQFDAWTDRLAREIEYEKNEDRKRHLEETLRRAKRDYVKPATQLG